MLANRMDIFDHGWQSEIGLLLGQHRAGISRNEFDEIKRFFRMLRSRRDTKIVEYLIKVGGIRT